MLRWWQQSGYPFSFGLDDVYVGPPCQDDCHRNGVCERNGCVCDDGYKGTISNVVSNKIYVKIE